MDFKKKYLKYKKKYLNLKKNEMVGSGKEEWVPKKYLVQNNRIFIELHKIDVDTKETKDIMFIYRSNSGLLWHMYTAKINLAQIPKIDELYSTSWLLDLSLQKKINDLLDEGSIEKMDSKHDSSRFSFSKYYIDTMTNFLGIEGDILNNQKWIDLWNEVIINNTEQNEILKKFKSNDQSDKDLSFIRDNIYKEYKCPIISKEKNTNKKMAEISRNTNDIYNDYNVKISEKLNNHFTIDNESKTCHFTTISNISFVDYDDNEIKEKNQREIYQYIRYIEAKIKYSVNSIKIKSNKTQKDFNLIFINYNFIYNDDVTNKYWDEDFPPKYQLNKEMFEKTYNAPLFLTNDLSSLNNRYPVYNKIIPMGIYTCKIFEYQQQVKGKLNDKYSNLYLFLGQYMNNMWPFKYLDESKCEHDKNIPNNYINRIEKLKKEIEELKEMNVENKNMIEILNKEYEKQKNVNKENYDNLLIQNSMINSKLEELQKEYNELLNKK